MTPSTRNILILLIAPLLIGCTPEPSNTGSSVADRSATADTVDQDCVPNDPFRGTWTVVRGNSYNTLKNEVLADEQNLKIGSTTYTYELDRQSFPKKITLTDPKTGKRLKGIYALAGSGTKGPVKVEISEEGRPEQFTNGSWVFFRNPANAEALYDRRHDYRPTF